MAISYLATLAFIFYAGVRPAVSQCAVLNLPSWPLTTPYPNDLILGPQYTPLGFGMFTYPNPESYKQDPCAPVTALTNKYILVAVQVSSLITNSRICVRQINNGVPSAGSCGSGSVIYCQQVIANNPIIDFYCDTSCDIADVSFYYKINVSDVTVSQDEYWCDNSVAVATANLPSSLLPVDPRATQTGTLQQVGAAPSLTPTLLVVMATFAVAVVNACMFV